MVKKLEGKYWSVLKTCLKKEGNQFTTNCSKLKLKSDDGKNYKTDVANTEQLLRIFNQFHQKKQSLLNYGWLKLEENESKK